jgi:hypothetical protein
LRLSETPRAWTRGVRESVGLPYALAGAVAAAAAVAVLLLPSLRTGADHRPAAPSRRDLSIDRRALPRVTVLKRSPGAAFTIKGAGFRVFPLAAPRAPVDPAQRPAGPGMRWLLVGVDCRNLSRARFRPSVIAYRLEDDRGSSHWPDVGGGTGPASLGQTGFLKRGELFRTRLSFRVPTSARRLTLVFEPVPDGSIHVEVALPLR